MGMPQSRQQKRKSQPTHPMATYQTRRQATFSETKSSVYHKQLEGMNLLSTCEDSPFVNKISFIFVPICHNGHFLTLSGWVQKESCNGDGDRLTTDDCKNNACCYNEAATGCKHSTIHMQIILLLPVSCVSENFPKQLYYCCEHSKFQVKNMLK